MSAVRVALAEMVGLMMTGEEPGAGSPWYQRAVAALESDQTVAEVCGVEYLAVRRDAVEYLKKHVPGSCIESGMCERIGDRLYTCTCGNWNPAK